MPKTLTEGRVKVAFLPIKPVSLKAPKVTELNSGLDLSAVILASGYTLGPTGSDTVSEPSLADLGNSTTYGKSNYSASVTLFRYLNSTGKSDSTNDVAFTTFTAKGIIGYLVERVGPLSSVAWAATDIVDVYEVVTDDPQPPSDRTGYIKFVQPFGVNTVELRAAVVA